LFIAAAFLITCSDSSSPDKADADKDADNDIESVSITADGGSFTTDSGITIVAPAGAVKKSTPITVSAAANDSEINDAAGIVPFSVIVECGPTGTTFEKPIEIRIPIDTEPTVTSCALFSRENDGDPWIQLDLDGSYNADGKYISINTTHFSTIAYSGIAAPGVRIFNDVFSKAGDHVSALAQLNDLLFRQSGIMSVSQKVGEEYYSVCGVDIDVQYKFGSAENQHVGDLTGIKTDDTTILQYGDDRTIINADLQITSVTQVIIYWKKDPRAHFLITYDFTATTGSDLILDGYSSTMYFTVAVAREENAEVNMDKDEDMVYDAYFDQIVPGSITQSNSDEVYYTGIVCPSYGTLMAFIEGTTAPGSCKVALWANEPESFLTALCWKVDDDGDYRADVLDPDLFIIGSNNDTMSADGSLQLVLEDGYTKSGQVLLLGLMGNATLNYNLKVRQLR